MNKFILLLGLLTCLVTVQARHFADTNDEESSEDKLDDFRPKERLARHRRRRWQSNYGFDYSAPSFYPPNNYYPDRRNDRDQEVIQNIYRLLEDINAYIRRMPLPPPPPQPIYIPYPVPFPTRVSCRVDKPQNTTSTTVPDVNSRIHPTMEDTNQNWGFVMTEEDDEDESDGARPISFEPLVPKQLLKRPAPKVEHGSQQIHHTTAAPTFRQAAPAAFSASSSSSSVPGMCNAAILSCCGFSGDKAQQRQCFANIGCLPIYGDGSACTPESIQRSLDSFKSAYSPAA